MRSRIAAWLLTSTFLLLHPATTRAELSCGPVDPYTGLQPCAAYVPIGAAAGIFALQAMDQWCWAASIAMVFDYYGHPVDQARIVAEAWGGIVNVPASPQLVLASVNRPWVDDHQQAFSVSGIPTTPALAAQELAQNHPLIIGSTGHAMVLVSLSYLRDAFGNGTVTEAYVVDPWPGRGIRMLTPQEWYGTTFLARVAISGASGPPGNPPPPAGPDPLEAPLTGCAAGAGDAASLLVAAVALGGRRLRGARTTPRVPPSRGRA